MVRIRKFFKDASGDTAIEYGLAGLPTPGPGGGLFDLQAARTSLDLGASVWPDGAWFLRLSHPDSPV